MVTKRFKIVKKKDPLHVYVPQDHNNSFQNYEADIEGMFNDMLGFLVNIFCRGSRGSFCHFETKRRCELYIHVFYGA
jgi:hypothetical protein